MEQSQSGNHYHECRVVHNMKYSILLAVVCFAACARTLPDAVSVEIADFAEYNDGYSGVGRVVLIIKNPTAVPVYSAAISLRLETGERCYYTTVYDDRGVPPETEVYITVEIAYLSPAERAIEGGAQITASFFS